MRRTTPLGTAALLAATAFLALGLAACGSGGTGGTGGDGAGGTGGSGGTGDGSGSGGSGGSGGGSTPVAEDGPGSTACFAQDWHADLQDLVDQLATQLQTSMGGHATVTAATAEGDEEMAVDQEGILGVGGDFAYTVTVAMDNGLTMVETVRHTGSMGANWAWDGAGAAGDVVLSEIHDDGWNVETTVTINGQTTSGNTPIDAAPPSSAIHVQSCTGGTLVTTQDGSPFTTTWHAAG